jgi:hypothetical protein
MIAKINVNRVLQTLPFPGPCIKGPGNDGHQSSPWVTMMSGIATSTLSGDDMRDIAGRVRDMRRLQEDVFGYRAGFFILLGLMVIWGVALMVNRTPPLHLNACEALKYYLGALDEASTKLPVETRQLLDSEAAACPEDDRGGFVDGNPHQ